MLYRMKNNLTVNLALSDCCVWYLDLIMSWTQQSIMILKGMCMCIFNHFTQRHTCYTHGIMTSHHWLWLYFHSFMTSCLRTPAYEVQPPAGFLGLGLSPSDETAMERPGGEGAGGQRPSSWPHQSPLSHEHQSQWGGEIIINHSGIWLLKKVIHYIVTIWHVL